MSTSILGLPPAPAELKAVIPYIQRAEELKTQDQIVSYWCAYYAAQLGISLKARDPSSREFLFALLGALEQMKSDLGANDAIDVESVSSAYVENFALKVFANADNEDRNGRSTRSTAKKFLAAANFLEILKTFPKKDISESNEDKIRYAKWKAADIAKAFREGRKPLPGPPGWAEEQEELKLLLLQEQQAQSIPSAPTFMPNVPSNLSLTSPSNSSGISPPSSSHISSFPPVHSPPSSSPPRFSNTKNNVSDVPSDNWSNTATPGTEVPGHIPSNTYSIGTPTPSTAGYDWPQESPAPGSSGQKFTQDASYRTRSGSESSRHSRDGKSSSPTKSSFKSASPDSDKRVHFSPSAAGSPPPSPSKQTRSSPPREYTGPADIYAPPPHPIPPPTVIYPIQPPAPPPSVPFSSPSPPRSYIYGPPASTATSPPRAPAQYAPPPPPTSRREVELTPELIVKVQKRCRFAISSLDYEDAEQAKKELRAALALLGE